MGVSEAVEEAREAADEWRLVRQMPKPKVRDVEAIEAHLVQVRVAYDKRAFEQDTQPAPSSAIPRQAPELDRWSVRTDASQDGSSTKVRVPIGEPYVAQCFMCKGARSFVCDDCGGSGQKRVDEYEPITGMRRVYYVPCGTCAGGGQIECNACRASGLVSVDRFVRVETGTLLTEGLAHAGKLTPELVQEISSSGSSVPLAAAPVANAYDEVPKGIPPSVTPVVTELLERDHGTETRTYGRAVTISKGWIVQLRLDDRTLHVWGEPARVSGDDAPVAGNTMLVWAAAGVGALAAVGALLYLLM